MAASRDDHTESRKEQGLEEKLSVEARTGGQRGVPWIAQKMRPTKKPTEIYPKMSFGVWVRRLGWRHLIAIIGVLFSLYPVMYIISTSISGTDNLANATFLPTNFDTSTYEELFSNPSLTPFMTWLRNSWLVSLSASAFTVALAAMAAYAFSRFRFKGRRVGLLTLLLVQIFPQFLAFVAILLIMIEIGEVFPAIGLNTLTGLMLVYLGGAIGFNTFLIKGFMDSIPPSLDESARVDGATQGTIFWKIILPLSRPILAVIFIISFINLFSEFLLARTLLTSTDNFTYAVGLQLFSNADFAQRWGLLSAAAVVGAAPIVITFLVAQRAIISGLTGGAVKG
jgi:arabinogalactan oligomer/maltooligosaccharide transport system permease protein